MSDRNLLASKLRVLELDVSASASDIKSAYRELVKVWHPDRFQGDQKLEERAERRLKELNEAYDWLIAHEELLRDQPISRVETSSNGKPQSPPERNPPPETPSGPATASQAPRRQTRRSPWLVVGLALVAFFVVAVAFNALSTPRFDDDRSEQADTSSAAVTNSGGEAAPNELSELLGQARADVVVQSINAWAVSDVPIQPAWSTWTSLRTLPSSIQRLAALVDEAHAKLITELTVGQVAVEKSVEGFDPTRFCFYTVYGQERDRHAESIKTIEFVRNYFADRIVDVASGKGRYSGPYPFEFDWFVVLEAQTGVVYSFIFNLQD